MTRHRPWLVVVLVGALVGVVFAAISTYDFIQHLDRQVHSLHCSFIPGVSQAGESGCQVAMMSPYSSVFRSQVWGGIPISLAAMSVFAFLAFYALDLMVTRRKDDPRATGFLALATALPAATSLVMLAISLTRLGELCKLCVAIYVASAACLVGGIASWRGAVRAQRDSAPAPQSYDDRHHRHHAEPAFVGRPGVSLTARLVAVGVDTGAASSGFLAGMFALGVAFVAVPVVLYLAMAPDHARFIGTCEALPRPDDTYGVMVRIERGGARGAPTIEVLDPLCPACRAFEQRLSASGLSNRLDRKAVLFPLDNTCNWMVTEATHPGACTVSEAVLCAGDKAPEVIAWAFEEQDRVRAETKADPTAAARMVKRAFPELAACVGSPEARSRLNKSMRWIVANNIRVLTPQVYVNGVKLCDEDVDLGLEYTLSNMLDRHARGTLTPLPLEKPAPANQAGSPTDTAIGSAGSAGSANAGGPAVDRTTPQGAASDTAGPDTAADKTSADKASADSASPGKAPGDQARSDVVPGAPSDRASSASTDKASADKASADKASTGKGASTEKPSTEKASAGNASADKTSADKSASDGQQVDKTSDRATPDKAASDKTDNAASDKAASDKTDNAASDKAASDKTDNAASDKAASDKAASDKAASDKAASDKAASDNADKGSPDKAAPGKADKTASDKTDNATQDKADKPTPRKPAPRKPRRPAPDKGASDPGPADQPVTRPGDVP